MWIVAEKRLRRYSACNHFLPGPLPLAFPLPNDLPSKPGRPLSLGLMPFRLSFLRSLRIAMLSLRFFCLAAIDAVSCSLRSSLCLT